MKKYLIIALFLSFMFVTKETYAIVDIASTVQTVMEKGQTLKKKVEEFKSRIEEEIKKLKQWAENMGCSAVSSLCGINKNTEDVKPITGVAALSGSGLDEGNISKKDPRENREKISKAHKTKFGAGDSLVQQKAKDEEVNQLLVEEISRQYAKSMAVHQSIMNENGAELYPYDGLMKGDETNDEGIISAQNSVALKSQTRLTRILELRAYMITSVDTAELKTRISREEE